MNNIVLIPTWQRSEMLYITLTLIRKSKYWKDHKYIFLVDHGHNPNVLKVIENFDGDKEVIIRERNSYKLTKQSFNLLDGYRYAASLNAELIYLIEEDIFISDDFFNFHQKVQNKGDYFCSIATKNNNKKVSTEGNPEDYYTAHFNYQSLGVCFRLEVIEDHILDHINDSYLIDPMRYVSENFPNSGIGKQFCEQDGLIRRIQERLPELPIASPVIPRAFHGGFYGYNRTANYKPSLTWQERVDDIYRIAFNEDELKKVTTQPFAFNDSRPFSLNIEPYDELVNIGYFS